MNSDWFLKLKEIDSLLKDKSKGDQFILDEKNRLTKLTSQLDSSKSESESLKKEIFELQTQLFEIEKKIKLFSDQKDNLFSIGKDFSHLLKEIDQLESLGLEKIEELEQLKSKESDAQIFQKGLSKTIDEISLEVNENVSQKNGELNHILLRIKLLEEELPQDFKNLFQKIRSKNLAHGPFSKNENGSCYFCRYKLSKIEESEIDIQKLLKQCPQCSRIFLPYGT